MADNNNNSNRKNDSRDGDSEDDDELQQQLPSNQLSHLGSCGSNANNNSLVEQVVKDISNNVRLSQDLFGSSTQIRSTPVTKSKTNKKSKFLTGMVAQNRKLAKQVGSTAEQSTHHKQ